MTMTSKEEEKLGSVERKVTRVIPGPVQITDVEYKMRTYLEIGKS